MSKQIKPEELSEIVTNLLTSPEKVGELEESSTYASFMTAIAEAVADHCGGEILQPAAEFDGVWYVGVHRTDSLPEGCDGVWGPYDKDGEL
ncbi:hypothetical protein [Pseudomonas sp. GOM6]|uniref:hypothetical protein n=1 Tax=Pseudomonas sp. GOM6 TaxID=3036944 RepID=UPI00240A0879|nr:hypothetical protein [Pseudomonas sp. GOM6]MDG1580902.1 hypothetical protein [Pseudomonas sp. GOM6]